MQLCRKSLPGSKYPGAFMPLFDILLQLNYTVRTRLPLPTHDVTICQLLYVNEGLCPAAHHCIAHLTHSVQYTHRRP